MPWTTPPGAGATVHIWNGYSLAERDRRWQAVRENAATAGFDCILVPLGNGIDGRYLTQLRCSAMVLPTDGRAPIVIADRRSSNSWVPEPWQTGREWAEPTGEALLDLGMARARIGVAGLNRGAVTHCSSIDGVVNHTALRQVMSKVPNASFENATDVVGFVRYVKSDEEIAFVRESAAVASAGLDELIKRARPGADAGVIYAQVLAHMLELGSEYFPLALAIESGSASPRRYTNPPLGCRLALGMLITNEIHAIRGAQLTQVCQPILLGKVSAGWNDVIALQREIYHAGLASMRPGVTFQALADDVDGFAGRGKAKAVMQLHGCGYGDDGPQLNPRSRGDRARNLGIKSGNVFVWRPLVVSGDESIHFSWGGPVMITDNGCEPLFKREHGMVEIR
jgi:Xaa-Pro aminopeptidase